MAKQTKMQRDKRRALKKKRRASRPPEPASSTPEPLATAEDLGEAQTGVEEFPKSEGRGVFSILRGLVRGDVNRNGNPNFMTRRRSLGEWAIIFGVVGGAYFLIRRFFL